MKKYDVVIAGAGPAGICAALEAARSGARTALIERYGCVGGNLTLGHVGPILGEGCKGSMAEEIEKAIGPVQYTIPDFERAKILLPAMLEKEGVDVYVQTVVTGAEKEGKTVKKVYTAGAATAIMRRTGTTTDTVDPKSIRKHLMERGVQLDG